MAAAPRTTITAAATVAVSALSISLIFSSVTSPPHPLHGCDACPRADEADVSVMHPGWAECTAPYWAGDEAFLGERVGELEVLPERSDEADDEDCPEYEADASKH